MAQPEFHFGGGEGSELWERASRYCGPPPLHNTASAGPRYLRVRVEGIRPPGVWLPIEKEATLCILILLRLQVQPPCLIWQLQCLLCIPNDIQITDHAELLTRARPGGRLSAPLKFFADSEKTAARSAAKFAIAVQPTI